MKKSCPLPAVYRLDDGFCDPRLTRPSLLAVWRLIDGRRVEFAVRDAVSLDVYPGPRVELHRLIVSGSPSDRRAQVTIVQLQELADLNGMPEVLRALEFFEAGRQKDAARYASAAGPRWSGLVDYFGGPV